MDNNQELLKQLIETERKIKKAESDKEAADKRIHQIKESNTYKIASSLPKVRKTKPQDERINLLETELEETRERLQDTRQALDEARLDDRAMNTVNIQRLIRGHHDDAALIDALDQIVGQKHKHDANYKDALHYAGRLFMNDKTDYKHAVYKTLLEGLNIEAVPEYIMREGLADQPLDLTQLSSFRASLNMRIRGQQLTGSQPEWRLDDKREAYAFIDRLNIKRPWTADDFYQAKDLPEETSVVVKPAEGAGARGVYLIHDFNDIIDLKRTTQLTSWHDLTDSMEADLRSGRVNDDRWAVEELIMEDEEGNVPAGDIKFYCFYGKVGLILEITRYPELKYCWWTADGQRVHTGKYEDDPFKGQGVTPEEVDMAAYISEQIPAPFIRIDFLRSKDGLVFGEFTPKPGNYDGFDTPTDQWMGDYFLEAEGRLERDLLNRKVFNIYNEL